MTEPESHGEPKTNWPALLILIAMAAASGWSPHQKLVAFGTSLLTFSALALAPTLLSNLQGTPAAGEAVALVSHRTAVRLVSWITWLAKRGRLVAWGLFVIGVGVIIVAIVLTTNTLNTWWSGLLIVIGFSLGFVAYTALALLRIGYTLVEGRSAEEIAKLLGSAGTAAWLGSASFAFGSFLIFLDAMRG